MQETTGIQSCPRCFSKDVSTYGVVPATIPDALREPLFGHLVGERIVRLVTCGKCSLQWVPSVSNLDEVIRLQRVPRQASSTSDRWLYFVGALAALLIVFDIVVLGGSAFGLIGLSLGIAALIFFFSVATGFQGGGCFLGLFMLGVLGLLNRIGPDGMTVSQFAIVGTPSVFALCGYVLGGIGFRTQIKNGKARVAMLPTRVGCPACKETIWSNATRCPNCTTQLNPRR